MSLFWASWSLLRPLGSLLEHLESHAEASGSVLGDFWAVFGASWELQEPFWSTKGSPRGSQNHRKSLKIWFQNASLFRSVLAGCFLGCSSAHFGNVFSTMFKPISSPLARLLRLISADFAFDNFLPRYWLERGARFSAR